MHPFLLRLFWMQFASYNGSTKVVFKKRSRLRIACAWESNGCSCTAYSTFMVSFGKGGSWFQYECGTWPYHKFPRVCWDVGRLPDHPALRAKKLGQESIQKNIKWEEGLSNTKVMNSLGATNVHSCSAWAHCFFAYLEIETKCIRSTICWFGFRTPNPHPPDLRYPQFCDLLVRVALLAFAAPQPAPNSHLQKLRALMGQMQLQTCRPRQLRDFIDMLTKRSSTRGARRTERRWDYVQCQVR